MLRPPEAGFEALSARERAQAVLMRWFDAQAAHRRVVGEMLGAKLYPSHPHHWVPMIFSLSRLIQWVREAALLDASGRRRQMEEAGLTWVFLQTLRVWLRDGTPGQGVCPALPGSPASLAEAPGSALSGAAVRAGLAGGRTDGNPSDRRGGARLGVVS